MEEEVYLAIIYNDTEKLIHMRASDLFDLNFKIELSKGVYYSPLMIAASKGFEDVI